METNINIVLKKIIYFVSIWLIQLTEGGHFVIYPVALSKIFGPDGGLLAYSVGFSFAGAASLINMTLTPLLLEAIGIRGLCFLFGACSLYSLLMLTAGTNEP